MPGLILPPHLDLMRSPSDVLDLFSSVPSRVPGDVVEEVQARADALTGSPCAARFPAGPHLPGWQPGTPAVVAEAFAVWEFLAGGGGGIVAGGRRDLHVTVFARYLAEAPRPCPAGGWSVSAGAYRPPGPFLLDPAGQAAAGRGGSETWRAAVALAREAVLVFRPVEPVRDRVDALVSVYDAHLDGGPGDAGADASGGHEDLARAWAAAAPDDVVAVLPELAGPAGYLRWAWEGLAAAHARLAEAVPGTADLADAAAGILSRVRHLSVPAELALAAGPEAAASLEGRIGLAAGGQIADDAFAGSTLAWLSRCLVAGQADACRLWLDMAMRVAAAVGGLPGEPAAPSCALPVGEWLGTVRDLSRVRVVRNVLADRLAGPAPAGPAGEAAGPADPLDRITGQPELARVLREAVADTGRPVRVHVYGPPGTCKETAADVLAAALEPRGLTREPVRVTAGEVSALDGPAAEDLVRKRVAECGGQALLVLSGLAEMLAACPGAAGALSSELGLRPEVHAVAVSDVTGDDEGTAVPGVPGDLFRPARTFDYGREGLGELLTRTLALRGARADSMVTAAATELAAAAQATPPGRRNRLLVEYLADLAVARARSRPHDGAVTLLEEDLPGLADLDEDEDMLREVRALIGLEEAKDVLASVAAAVQAEQARRDAGGAASGRAARNMVFAGGTGSGKTLMGEAAGKLLRRLGVVSRGHLTEVTCGDLSAGTVPDVLERAAGGILLISGACGLDRDGASDRAVLSLLGDALDRARDLVAVVAGPDPEITEWVTGLGWRDRFPVTVPFPGYTAAELAAIFAAAAGERGLVLTPEAEEQAEKTLARAARGGGNARAARLLLEQAVAAQAQRFLGSGRRPPGRDALRIEAADIPAASLRHGAAGTDPQEELDGLIGLGDVKRRVRRLVAEAKAEDLRRGAGMPVASPARHLVFTGNPGTAKTTVARLLARIYAGLGLLSSGHLVEVSRAELVGQFLGQTAPRVQDAVRRAQGGVLFIDEAYSLAGTGYTGGDPYGQEAVTELVRQMENNRADLVVIAAGYPQPMERFLRSNPGLASRFPGTISFPDYSHDELAAIFARAAAQEGFRLTGGAQDKARAVLAEMSRDDGFGGGRDARTLFEEAASRQAERLTAGEPGAGPPGDDDIRTITAADVARPEGARQRKTPGLYL